VIPGAAADDRGAEIQLMSVHSARITERLSAPCGTLVVRRVRFRAYPWVADASLLTKRGFGALYWRRVGDRCGIYTNGPHGLLRSGDHPQIGVHGLNISGRPLENFRADFVSDHHSALGRCKATLRA